VSTRAKEKDLELIVRVEPGLESLFIGDVGRIRQIATNLLGNAVKFTDEGHVLVDVTGESVPAGTKLTISVTDTGIGIPEEKLKLVFEKFSQVDTARTGGTRHRASPSPRDLSTSWAARSASKAPKARVRPSGSR
jgi:signal transduction histidine kinase